MTIKRKFFKRIDNEQDFLLFRCFSLIKNLMIKIFEILEADDGTLEAVNLLLPQLSKSAKLIGLNTLQKLSNSECTRLYVAKEGDFIFGMLSLVVFSIPTGTKAWIEDVVVDEGARGKGVGRKLIEACTRCSKGTWCKKCRFNFPPQP